MTIYLPLPPYLRDFFTHEMGGGSPVHLKKGCMEAIYLETFLTPPPSGYIPDLPGADTLAIELPNFRSLDTRSAYYLPSQARLGLADMILNRFDLAMWTELHRFANLFKRQDRLIYAFMEKYGIEPTATNWDAVAKRYRRKRDIYLRGVRAAKSKKVQKNSPDFDGAKS